MQAIKIQILILLTCLSAYSQTINYKEVQNINYYDTGIASADTYIKSQCLVDIYYPENKKKVPVIVWFHGGGLTSGQKEIPEALKNKGVCVVGVGYRLSPKVKAEKCIADAAAAVAWVFENIESYNGDPGKIFISGHSAGGYLAAMVGYDKHWLQKYEIDADAIAGLIPFSGHTITHFTIREERGIPGTQPVIDEMAPLYHVRPDAAPTLLITGDRELELLGRYEENAYFYRMLKVVKHPDITLYEMDGYDHGMTEPAFPLLLKFVKDHSK